MKAKRGLLASGRAATKTAVEHRATDQFRELPGRRKAAQEAATAQGHELGSWLPRHDVYGRQDARCRICNRLVTVCVEPPVEYGLSVVYGKALTERCESGGQ